MAWSVVCVIFIIAGVLIWLGCLVEEFDDAE